MTATAIAAGVGGRSAVLAAAILVGQTSIGWANDYVDAGRDAMVARTDKPIATGQLPRGLVGGCAAGALLADVPLSLAVGWRPGAAHLVAVGSAWLYDLRLKETLASWAPYALSFGLLPVIIATALGHGKLPQPAIVAAAACLGVAAHFANTVGDADDDRRTDVRGLPQRIGPATSTVVATLLVASGAGLLVLATSGAALTIAAAVVAAGVAIAVPLRLGRGAARADAFRLVIAAVAILIVAFVLEGGNRLTG